jgi:DNA-directed RNA polymerase sigma subunit (sigma70/sigma32)
LHAWITAGLSAKADTSGRLLEVLVLSKKNWSMRITQGDFHRPVLTTRDVMSEIFLGPLCKALGVEEEVRSRELIRSAWATLAASERDVLRLRYGMDTGNLQTTKAVARHFRVSVDEVGAIEARARHKLAVKIREMDRRCVVMDAIWEEFISRSQSFDLVAALQLFGEGERAVIRLLFGVETGTALSERAVAEELRISIDEVERIRASCPVKLLRILAAP